MYPCVDFHSEKDGRTTIIQLLKTNKSTEEKLGILMLEKKLKLSLSAFQNEYSGPSVIVFLVFFLKRIAQSVFCIYIFDCQQHANVF